jgi:DNA-binding NarL/FixJ family response regulator
MPDMELKITEIDALTGDVIERAPSKLEADQYKEAVDSQKQSQLELEAKLSARDSALAKLAALGLTEEEISAL